MHADRMYQYVRVSTPRCASAGVTLLRRLQNTRALHVWIISHLPFFGHLVTRVTHMCASPWGVMSLNESACIMPVRHAVNQIGL